eukprot:TRINITY_DN2543_c1_g1_i3.p1 TRINITY_DN2543_c1_g1~~TRINITY_DN2543_c1_g1_i3.p1  ORF type:complete len:141 (+),score=11.00 TRINITY_DN2543_c1_g1_i3:173-595(+)
MRVRGRFVFVVKDTERAQHGGSAETDPSARCRVVHVPPTQQTHRASRGPTARILKAPHTPQLRTSVHQRAPLSYAAPAYAPPPGAASVMFSPQPPPTYSAVRAKSPPAEMQAPSTHTPPMAWGNSASGGLAPLVRIMHDR